MRKSLFGRAFEMQRRVLSAFAAMRRGLGRSSSATATNGEQANRRVCVLALLLCSRVVSDFGRGAVVARGPIRLAAENIREPFIFCSQCGYLIATQKVHSAADGRLLDEPVWTFRMHAMNCSF